LKSSVFKLNWHLREEPRIPTAVVAVGPVAKEFAMRILASDDLSMVRWKGIATSDAIVLLGESETLPWVNGVAYLGSDERAPHLLLPTNRDPNVPVDLLQQALIERCPFPPPLAMIESSNTVVSLSEAREITREVLKSWLLAAP
jgi:hypothetical protein